MHQALFAVALQLIRWPSETPPLLDGRLDEPSWQTLPAAAEFYESLPQPGARPSSQTSIFVTVDQDFLYLAAALEDPQGSPRQSNISRRDHIPESDDSLTFILDPQGTRVFGQVFQINPDCSTNDGLYQEATRAIELSADYEHVVACQQQEHGWTMELRIPLKELRFAEGDQKSWNLLVLRNLVRDRKYTWANAPLPREPLCLLCYAPSMESPAELPDPEFLRFTPYALARRTEKTRISQGLDIKYRLDAATILDATVNPDFSQVDLDEPQLAANTRFAVSYPENRPFFLEGADILDTPLKVMSTRSIIQPSWGLKYTRRTAEHDSMILSGDDRSENRILLPGAYRSQYRTIRAKQQFLIGATQWKRTNHQLGLSLTHRNYEELGSNQSLSLGALHYLTTRDSLRWQTVLSQSEEKTESGRDLVHGEAAFGLLHHKGESWHSSLELKSFSRHFRSDLGFNPRNDYRLGILTNAWHQDFGSLHLASYLRLSRKNELSPRPIQVQNAPGLTLSGFMGTEFTLESRPETRERIHADGPLHRYQQHYASVGLYPGSLLTWLQCDLTWGERLDVNEDRVRPGRVESCSARLALGKKLEWNASFSQEQLKSESWRDTGKPILRNRVMRHLIVLPFDAHFSLRYIRQEAYTERLDEPESWEKTNSWNLSYDKAETVTAHVGVTLVQTDEETQQDYYLKLSSTLP